MFDQLTFYAPLIILLVVFLVAAIKVWCSRLVASPACAARV